MADYDLVVIGSGPAGEKGAAQAAWFGKRVAVIERQARLGGACVNTGTLPSKTLRETALYISGFRQRRLYGLNMELMGGLTVPQLMCRQEPVVTTEIQRIHHNLDRHRVDLIAGNARFLDEHTILVDGALDGSRPRTLTTDVALVACGSRPFLPAHIPFDDPDVDDSDTILKLDRIPASMVILGGGVIGCEYASIFASLGVKVTLCDRVPRLLPFLDREIADLLTRRLEDLGVEVILDVEARLVEKKGATVCTMLSSTKSRDDVRELRSDKLLCASGRTGNTAGLDLEKVGVTTDARGLVKVNEHFRIAGATGGRIYAAGDVVGFPALASTSMEQARVAMCHAFGDTYKTQVSAHLPYGVYTIPEVSMIGETEESATQKGYDVTIGRARYSECARGQIIGDLDGMVKLVFDSGTRKLLGVHIIGERATELVHIGQMAIHFGGTVDALIYEVFNYPSLSELYKYAAYNGLGNLARRRALAPA